ncbi:Multidrug resistance-associated protein 9 [Portunus trituberculatus]|uniref:Multidrug resistance-associated protein 9 n=1 Tax=Portunus trituberculatus TaxID=210409 RepID=A0A5B7EV81_PORTR|nr:Multidrug resistance-associated protein 9 [Portunus trituberculatus]
MWLHADPAMTNIMAENESQDASTLVKEGNNADNEEDTLLDQSDCASNASPLKSVGFNLQTDVAEENDDEIDLEIDDALDEGYMGMECTLERGFSLNESAIAKDLRHERYSDVAVKYMPGTSLHRYKPSLKHFIPIRKSSTVRDEMPVDGAGLYSFITISWITNMMWKAYKTGLKDDDVPLCSKYDMCEYNTDREDIVSPVFFIESADLKIVEAVDGVKMETGNAVSFLASLVSVNDIQLHFESRRLPGHLSNARQHCRCGCRAFWWLVE